MTFQAAYRYQLADSKKAVPYFYGIIFLLFLTLTVGITSVGISSDATVVSGMDTITPVFLFVAGLNSFKESFLMMLQNGVSRKTMFCSKLLAALTIAGAMAAIDNLILLAGGAFSKNFENVSFLSVYEPLYLDVGAQQSPLLLHLHIYLYDVLLYFCLFCAGLLITMLFYRLNKMGKVAVGAGVPVFLTFIYPIVDTFLFRGKISAAILRLFDVAFGITTRNPYAAMLSLAVCIAATSALGWLLARRAVMKV